jgi:cell division protein FtsZ
MSHLSVSTPTAEMAEQPALINSAVDYGKFDVPKVFRNSRDAVPPSLGADSSPQAKAMLEKGADYYEIPAFLRKQAD